MLTDKEIQTMCNDCIRNRKTTNDFARVIERAVLAKAGELEPIYQYSNTHNVNLWTDCNKDTYDIMRKEYRRVVCAHPLPAQAIPEGYVIAPIEPTDAMLDAGVAMALQLSVHGEGGWSKYLGGLYKQMLSASKKQ